MSTKPDQDLEAKLHTAKLQVRQAVRNDRVSLIARLDVVRMVQRSYKVYADANYIEARIAERQAEIDKAQDWIDIYRERHAEADQQIASFREEERILQSKLAGSVENHRLENRRMEILAQLKVIQQMEEAAKRKGGK